MLKYIRIYMPVVGKYDPILHKGLQHPQILISVRVQRTNSLCIMKGDCNYRDP
jgi:hypothetical protein